MIWWQILLITLAALVGAVSLLTLTLFVVYWFNLDMKLINWLYNKLGKHYDSMKRDREL
jgi:hypothetical protein